MNVKMATRADLTSYLEGRGFAVYSREHVEDLRTAAVLDMLSVLSDSDSLPYSGDECPLCRSGTVDDNLCCAGECGTAFRECDHRPDEHTFSYSGSDLIIDVNCRDCGMSGSFVVSPDDINWK